MGSRGSSFSGAVVPELAVGEEQRFPRASNALSALLARAPLALGIVILAAAYYGAAKIGYALEFAGPVAAVVCHILESTPSFELSQYLLS